MILAIACDLSGYPLKEHVLRHLNENHKDIQLLDFGSNSSNEAKPFYEQADLVATAIQDKKADKGVLVCGTGQGMVIAANKYKGIYAALVSDILSAERAKVINNANVITMGCWVTAPVMACQIVDRWLSVAFTENMDAKREFIIKAFNKVKEIEEEQFK